MKKIVFAVLVILLSVCLFGCIRTKGSYKTTFCISNQTSDSFSMQYESLDGDKAYIFTTKKETTLSIKFVTEQGKLSCKITDKSGKEYYNCDDVQTEEFTLPLGGKGEYTVSFHAEGHKGAFYFTIQ